MYDEYEKIRQKEEKEREEQEQLTNLTINNKEDVEEEILIGKEELEEEDHLSTYKII